MSLLKIMLVSLVLCSISVLSLSCASKSAPTPEGQVVTVQRGNLRTDITSVGNLALSYKVDLAFEMPGTVEEVLVKAGESVKKGQVLAKLGTSEWEDEVTALTRKVTQAERQLTAAERQVTTKKRDLVQAQINLNNAELALEKAEVETTDALELEVKRLAVDLAKGRVEDAQIAIKDALTGIEDAKENLKDAQKALDDAKSASPVITVPFDGFITKVNVSGGDEVKKGTVAVTLADPNKFEADILVNEMNILNIKLGENATASLDAVQGMILAAKVTDIAPSGTIQSGVVNYKVKVEIQPLTQEQVTEIMKQGQQAQTGQTGGQQTQRQQAQAGQTGGQQAQRQQRQVTTMVPKAFQLREGLTVTISILIEERRNVLLVPNGAITSRGGQAYVQVWKDTVIEERSIKTGISNWQYTEVTDGLTEGEKVVVPKGTTGTTSTTRQTQQQAPLFFPGVTPGVPPR